MNDLRDRFDELAAYIEQHVREQCAETARSSAGIWKDAECQDIADRVAERIAQKILEGRSRG